MEKALIFLREKGLAKAVKRSEKRAVNGIVVSYIHGNGSLGVLLELNSETDFAARSEKFGELAHEIALQIAANNPEYISIGDIPADIMKKEKEIAGKDIDPKKPEAVREKIIDGKLSKFYEDFYVATKSAALARLAAKSRASRSIAAFSSEKNCVTELFRTY